MYCFTSNYCIIMERKYHSILYTMLFSTPLYFHQDQTFYCLERWYIAESDIGDYLIHDISKIILVNATLKHML